MEITSHEWIVAQKLEGKYWLYIVENVENNEKIVMTKVNNPFNVFSGVSQKISLLQFKILIDQWKAFLNQNSPNQTYT